MKKRNLFIVVLIIISGSLYAQQHLVDTLKYCVNQNNIGLGGFDPISYFKALKPEKGLPKITAEHEGVIYHFTSDENRKLFLNNSKKYLPQFGGWCSMSLAMGKATTPTYDIFYIDAQNNLYLFERTLSVNGKALWLQDVARNKQAAQKNYAAYRQTGKIK